MYSSFAIVNRAALCRRCRQPLATGEVVVEVPATTYTLRVPDGPWTHVRCAVDVSPYFAQELFRRDPLPFDQRDELELLATNRCAALVTSVKKARPTDTAPAEPNVEAARDPFGRPRVQVLITGSAAWIQGGSYGDSPSTSVFSIVQDGLNPAAVSPRREYVFVRQGSSVHVRMDPAQPTVASILIVNLQTKPSSIYRQRVAEWVALNLPPPILWVIGSLDDRQKVDDFVRQLRVFVERAGVPADLCPVLLSRQMTDESVREAVALLDEHVQDIAVESLEQDATVRSSLLLQKIIDSEAEDALAAALVRAGRGVGRARVAERKQIANTALKALRFTAHRSAILGLVQAAMVKLAPDILLAELRRMLEDTGKRLGNDLTVLVEILVFSGHAELLHAVLRDKLAQPGLSKARRSAIESAVTRMKLAIRWQTPQQK